MLNILRKPHSRIIIKHVLKKDIKIDIKIVKNMLENFSDRNLHLQKRVISESEFRFVFS